MNKQSENFVTAIRAVILMAILVISTDGFGQSKKHADPYNNDVKVEYLGSIDDTMVVGVKYNNLSGSRFVLAIYNNDGEVLFRNNYADTKFQKTFWISKEFGDLKFILSGRGKSFYKTFAVTKNTRVVDDLVVKKVD